jgi:hypothetical protein
MDRIDYIVRNIKLLMAARGIANPTQLSKELEEFGITYSQPNLSRLLAKQTKQLDLNNAIGMAKFFKVTLGQLVGIEPLDSKKWVKEGDVYKIQIDDIYLDLNNENRDALALHANLLLKAQGGSKNTVSDPYPVKPREKEKQ